MNYKKGDRLRVVVEGVVTDVYDNYAEIGTNSIDLKDAESVELIAPQANEGDILDTVEAVNALPIGSVVKSVTGPYVALQKSNAGWFCANFSNKSFNPSMMHFPVKVLHIPEPD